MKKIWGLIFCVLIAFVYQVSLADQIAITEDGRKVLLKDDGTWEYLQEEVTEASQYHFRKTRWGMSKDEVKKSETIKLAADRDTVLGYETQVAGLKCLLLYVFTEERLVRAKYVIVEQHTNKNDFLLDFNTLQQKLTQKYGKPKNDETYWRDDLYKDDVSDWGMAISIGHLAKFSSWETSETKIVLALKGDNFEIEFAVEYTSISLEKIEEKMKDKKDLDDL